jgi:hypothetical protein
MFDLSSPLDQALIVEPSTRLAPEAVEFAAHANGEGTRIAYPKAWHAYASWCKAQSLVPLAGNPTQIGSYLAFRAHGGLSASSIGIAAAAIKMAHNMARVTVAWDDPDLARVLAGIRRQIGTRPVRQSAAVTTDKLALMLATRQSPDTILGARDRAMLVIGYHGALTLLTAARSSLSSSG